MRLTWNVDMNDHLKFYDSDWHAKLMKSKLKLKWIWLVYRIQWCSNY